MYMIAGRRREMGLGGYPTITLDAARARADDARRMVADGVDPIDARREERVKAAVPTFLQAAEDYLKIRGPSFRNPKHLAQWRVTLGLDPVRVDRVRIDAKAHKSHAEALAKLLVMPVDEVDTAAVLSVLKPIWHEAPETAARIRQRIGMVLDAAKVAGHRSGDNPAQWQGHLALMLPARPKASRGHHAAAEIDEVPTIVARLRATGGVSASALEFLILTATRTGEVLGARWSEIDLAGKLWTVPGQRMKAGREHRVPLSDRALAILTAMGAIRHSDTPDAFVFPGQKAHKGLSQMALAMVLRRAEIDVTVHGFRSSFRDWCGDATTFPREVAEAALAHAVGDATEAAYRRGSAIEKRRELMKAWSEFVEPIPRVRRS